MTTSLSQTTATDWRLGFTSLDEETAVDRLPVSGELPAWLDGALVRVTPALLEVGERRVAHWFDGLAMLNRFGFADGEVSYRSRFLDSEAYRAAREGRIRRGGFATDPCRSIFQRVQSIFSPGFTDNANVNLARLGGRHIAMTETPLPIEFDAGTLATRGPLAFADGLKAHVTTAHPHHDPERGELVNYFAHLSRTSEYVLYGLPAGSTERRVIARLPVKEPAYMHAFGMSGDHLILAEYPLRVNPLKLALSGRPFIENYVWRPEQGTRFLVVDRRSGELRGSHTTDAFFCFHHVNAFERDGELAIDLVAYDDPGVIDALYLDRSGPRGALPHTELRRYTIGLDGGGVGSEVIPGGHDVELPRIDYRRRNGRDYGHAWFAGSDGQGHRSGPGRARPLAQGWLDRLVKLDLPEGRRHEWSEPGRYPGEPVFVPRPGGDEEDDGVVLSIVLDAEAGRSFLLVLDAASLEELARADAPHHIPFGFHGQYFGAGR